MIICILCGGGPWCEADLAADGTTWENFASAAPQPGDQAKADFVGFSGVGPIVYRLEFAIGLKPDAIRHSLRGDVRDAEGLRRPVSRQRPDRFADGRAV